MEYSLRQAAYTNPDSEIILLGDESNVCFDFVTHVDMKNYFRRAGEFTKIYRHYSTNPYGYELFCFQRWLILEDYLLDRGCEEVFVCDSDVMLYSNITGLMASDYPDIDAGVMFGVSEEYVSVSLSYWKTEYLKCFNECILNTYKDENFMKDLEKSWHEIIAEKKVGAISDMTISEHFYHKYRNRIKIVSLVETRNGSFFDININLQENFYPEEYQMRFGKKKLLWENKIPYGYSLMQKKFIRFNCIHCQGPAKFSVSQYYTGEYFKGKFMLDLKFAFLNFLAFWYQALRIRYRFAFLFNIIFKKQGKIS